jgi:ribonuclease HII
MLQALQGIEIEYDQIILDGSINYFADDPQAVAIVRADNSVPAVSAASIVAKVARDKYMADAAEHYPGYGFEKHVGYGTALHIAALHALGVCELHRKSYKPIQALLQLAA